MTGGETKGDVLAVAEAGIIISYEKTGRLLYTFRDVRVTELLELSPRPECKSKWTPFLKVLHPPRAFQLVRGRSPNIQ